MNYFQRIGIVLLIPLCARSYSANAQVSWLKGVTELSKWSERAEGLELLSGERKVKGLSRIIEGTSRLERLNGDNTVFIAAERLNKLEREMELAKVLPIGVKPGLPMVSKEEYLKVLLHSSTERTPPFNPDYFYLENACYSPQTGLDLLLREDLNKANQMLERYEAMLAEKGR